MATPHVINATFNMLPPRNLAAVQNAIQNQLSNIKASIDLQIKASAVSRINSLNTALADLNKNLKETVINANAAQAAITGLGNAAKGASSAAKSINSVANASTKASQGLKNTASQLELTTARFSSFVLVAQVFNRTISTFESLVGETIKFQHELVRLTQVGNDSKEAVAEIGKEATRLGVSLGVSSQGLIKTASTLRQAGVSAADTKTALSALARASLSPSFTSSENAVEGLIAAMGQFGLKASQFESALGSIAAVSNKYAVESNDLVTAIRITGSAFAQTGGSLEELLAVFTSIRQATREAPETIATSLRNLLSSLQQSDTVEKLRGLGISLRDVDGRFVGTLESFKRLRDGLAKFDPKSQTYFDIVDEVGGKRQVGRLIAGLNNYKLALEAVGEAKRGQQSLDLSTSQAQESLSVKLQKVTESFFELFKVVSESSGFRTLLDITTKLLVTFSQMAKTLDSMIPAITTIIAARGAIAVGTIGATIVKGGLGIKRNSGGPVPGEGFTDTVPAMLTPGEYVVDKRTVAALGGPKFFEQMKRKTRGYNQGGFVERFGPIPTGLSDDEMREYAKRLQEYMQQDEKEKQNAEKIYNSITDYEKTMRQRDYDKYYDSDVKYPKRKSPDRTPIPLASEADVFVDRDSGIGPNRKRDYIDAEYVKDFSTRKRTKTTAYYEKSREAAFSKIYLNKAKQMKEADPESYKDQDVNDIFETMMANRRKREGSLSSKKYIDLVDSFGEDDRSDKIKNVKRGGAAVRKDEFTNVQSLFTNSNKTNLKKREKVIADITEMLRAKTGDVISVDKLYRAAQQFVNANGKVKTAIDVDPFTGKQTSKIASADFGNEMLKNLGAKTTRFNVDVGNRKNKISGYIDAVNPEMAEQIAAQYSDGSSTPKVKKAGLFSRIFSKRHKMSGFPRSDDLIDDVSVSKKKAAQIFDDSTDSSDTKGSKRNKKNPPNDSIDPNDISKTSKFGRFNKLALAGLAASTVSDQIFGTPKQAGILGIKGNKTASVLSSAITSGSAGFLAGAQTGNPIIAASAGIAGALLGAASAAESFTKQLNDAKLNEARLKFEESGKGFLNKNKTTLNDQAAFDFRKYVETGISSGNDTLNSRSLESVAKLPLYLIGQGKNAKDQINKEQFDEARKDFAPVAEAGNTVLDRYIESGQIKDPKKFLRTQAGRGIFSARFGQAYFNSDRETLQSPGGQRKISKDVEQSLIKEITEKTATLNAQKQLTQSINRTNYAFASVVNAVTKFNFALDRVSENTEKKIDEANFKLGAGTGTNAAQSLKLGVGNLGPQGQFLEQLGGKNGLINKAELNLPQVLEKAFAANQLSADKATPTNPGESLVTSVTRELKGAGFGDLINGQIINAFKDENAAKNIASDFQRGDVTKVTGSLLNNFDPIKSAYENRKNDLERQGGKFVQGLGNVNEINAQIGGENDRSVALRLAAARQRTSQNLAANGNTSRFGLENLPGGLSKIKRSQLDNAFALRGTNVREGLLDIDLATTKELQQPFQSQQERLTGLNGVAATNASAIQARLEANKAGLSAARNKVLANEGTNPAAALQGASDVSKFQQEISNNIQALKNLQDTTKSLAGAQEKLARVEGQIEGDKKSRLGFAEQLINASPQERQEIQKNSFLAQRAIQQGNLSGFNDKQAQGVLQFLNQIGDTRLQTGANQFAAAGDIKNQLLINSGFGSQNSNDPLFKQRDELNQTINAGNNQAIQATNSLAVTLQDENMKFIGELSTLFNQYFGGGAPSITSATAADVPKNVNGPGFRSVPPSAIGGINQAAMMPQLENFAQPMADFSTSAQALASVLAQVNIPSEIVAKIGGTVDVRLNGLEFVGEFSKELDSYVRSIVGQVLLTQSVNKQDVGV